MWRSVDASAPSGLGGLARSGATRKRATTSNAAPTANTYPMLAYAKVIPTKAPATMMLTLSIQPMTTLVAVSSLTSRVSAGTTTAWAGRVVETAADANTAPAYANTDGAPESIAVAVAAVPMPCATYPPASMSIGER